MVFEIVFLIALAALIATLYYFRNVQNLNNNLKKGEAFLAINQQDPKVFTTTSGLQYLPLKETKSLEQTLLPHPESTVAIHYQIKDIDGTLIESSEDSKHPISFELSELIEGWREGLLLMRKGDKNRLFIPNGLAYGKQGSRKIAAGLVVVIDVHLVDFY